jgi:hypothetical protein
MSQISPPIRILLVSAVAFMAAWMLFLRPKDDAGTPVAAAPSPAATPRPVESGGQKAQSLAGQAVEKANDATAAQDAQAEKLAGGAGDDTVKAPAAATAPATSAAPATPATGAKPATLDPKTTAGLPIRVLRGIAQHKVVVLLFWNPDALDDQGVRKALSRIDRHHNKVLAHATNVKRIAAYQQITRGADVEQSPTVVVIDRKLRVDTLVGYVDRQTIDQAVEDALRSS